VAGVLFLLLQRLPGLAAWLDLGQQWPLIIVGVGGLFLLAAFANPPLAVPAALIGGVGALLYYQNATGNWESWSYAWTLIPGFVGLGLILKGLLEGKRGSTGREGGRLLLISFIMFALFGSFLGGWLDMGLLWPLLLIFAGGWLLLRSARRR
jgi:hypothetical protein